MLLVGVGPLLIVIGLDSLGFLDAGNAMGPGILAFLTLYPSLGLISIGAILSYRKSKKISELPPKVANE